MKYKYLTNTTENHNKYYEMQEEPGGRFFTARYGRIGISVVEFRYSMEKWDKKYNKCVELPEYTRNIMN